MTKSDQKWPKMNLEASERWNIVDPTWLYQADFIAGHGHNNPNLTRWLKVYLT